MAQKPCSKLPESGQLSVLLDKVNVKINPLDFRMNCNVNESIKAKLISLIAEKCGVVNRIDSSHCKTSHLISGKAKQDIKVYAGINDIIKTVAFLYMQEAIPILEQSLIDSNACFNLPIVKLALARFGNKKFETDIIDTLKPDFSKDGYEWVDDFRLKGGFLSFINSQESVSQLSNWLDLTKTYDYAADRMKGKSAYLIVGYIREIILNKEFHDIINGKDLTGLEISDNKLINQCKNWMIRNKGKYQLNKGYYIY